MQRKCKHCGSAFEASHGNQKVCSTECHRSTRRAKAAAYRKANPNTFKDWYVKNQKYDASRHQKYRENNPNRTADMVWMRSKQAQRQIGNLLIARIMNNESE